MSDEFVEKVRIWVQVDNEPKKYNEHMKQLRHNKNTVTNDIVTNMFQEATAFIDKYYNVPGFGETPYHTFFNNISYIDDSTIKDVVSEWLNNPNDDIFVNPNSQPYYGYCYGPKFSNCLKISLYNI